jgi:hypothetical protein
MVSAREGVSGVTGVQELQEFTEKSFTSEQFM